MILELSVWKLIFSISLVSSKKMTTCKEHVFYPEDTTALLATLTPAERVFVYYMFRSNLPFNRMARDQGHRYNNEILEMCEYLYDRKDSLDPNFVADLETYIVYLWANHGIYFHNEYTNNKRTPGRIGLTSLTQKNLMVALQQTQYPEEFLHLFPTIFDPEVDAEMCVDESIEKSGNNYYGRGMTEEDYKSLPAEVQNRINAYCYLNQGKPSFEYYGVTGKYAPELTVVVCWLTRALYHARKYPTHFDAHLVRALEYLIEYYVTGDEDCFKKHSIEWLQAKGRVFFTQGFIETYSDPKKIRGDSAAEVTVRTVDLDSLTPLLLKIEETLPNPPEYKRDTQSAGQLNVSINRLIHGSGHNGPNVAIAAYCLPNYEDIRSIHGSKQVIYPQAPSAVELLNSDLYKQFRTANQKAFIEQYDPKEELSDVLWNVQVLLHETIGHGSGRLHQHTFTETKTIGDKVYQPGEMVTVTDMNISEFLGSESNSLEELRAEINALYMSITSTEALAAAGLYKDWYRILGKEKLQEQCVIEMCRHMLRRYLSQSENIVRINGAHARANVTIANYLIASGGVRIHEELVTVDGSTYHVLEMQVVDLTKCIASTTELLQRVQRIKSTGDYVDCRKLLETYTQWPVSLEMARQYRKYQDDIRKKLLGPVKATVRVYPMFEPVREDGEIVEMRVTPCKDFVAQNRLYDELMLSMD
jgi:hypothetical protein